VIEKNLNRFVSVLEIAVSAALVIVAAMLVVSLTMQFATVIVDGFEFGREEFTRLISTALEVFIVIELFRIALAYMNHTNVIPTVFEAALVAVARKFVVFEPKESFLQEALGLAALLLAIGVSWWLLKQTNVCDLD
jgi:uncharacterized membrane protein (DUF373 family)